MNERERICEEIVQLIKKGGNSNWKKALGIMVDEGISVYKVNDEMDRYCSKCDNTRGCNGCEIYSFNNRFKYE